MRCGTDRVNRAGVMATKFRVRGEEPLPASAHADEHAHAHAGAHSHHQEPGHHHHGHTSHDEAPSPHEAHRTLDEIYRLIDGSALSGSGRDRAKQLFARIGAAEAAIHGIPVDRVHLHEVGALDSIIDIVGTVHALETLAADRVVASPLNVGQGSVRSAHGLYPVPAPATARLLGGVPIFSGPQHAELVTPTGALLITGYADTYGPIPPMRLTTVGYGAGSRDFHDSPNVLRVLVGEADGEALAHSVVVIEADIDDMNPQIFGVLLDRLLGAGRPGRLLYADSHEEESARNAADGGGCSRLARAFDGDGLPRDHDHRCAVPRDGQGVSRSRDSRSGDAARFDPDQGRKACRRSPQCLSRVR